MNIGTHQHHNTRRDAVHCHIYGIETGVSRGALRFTPKTYGGLSELLSFMLLAAVTVSVMAVLWLMIILSQAG